MYKVVEFNLSDAEEGEIEVVRAEWITPRKKQCYWPPTKVASKFAKLLSSPGPSTPDENWSLHKLKKILYETSDLIKAREKCRQAEKYSEVGTEDDDQQVLNRKRKRIPVRRYSGSDNTSEDENYVPMKFPNKNNLENDSQKTNASNSMLQDFDPPKTKNPSSVLLLQDFNFDTPSRGSPALDDNQTPKLLSRSSLKCSAYQSTLDRIADLLGDIQSELKDIQCTQYEILNKLSSSSTARPLLDQIKDFPVALPIKSKDDLTATEQWLEDDENKELLAKYLGFIGGNKTNVIVRKILEKVFDNTFATHCNWTGKNKKNCLKGLKVMQTIFDAVRRNHIAEKATDSEVTEVVTSWFRFAKDRDGGREKRRSANLPAAPQE